MKTKILIFFTALLSTFLVAQSPNEIAISKTLNNYINGSSYNDIEQIESAFSEDATLYLTIRGVSKRLTIKESSSFYKDKVKGSISGRIGTILSIEITNDVATAQAEIAVPKANLSFTDLFLLMKIAGEWKIISKTATKEEIKNNGRILFIVSNTGFYKGTTIKTGTSFSEVIEAYETFVKAGYYVDFVSPNGGAIFVAYYDVSEEIQKKYFDDSLFMNRLKYTKKPEEINASSYDAVYYVGGGAAMFDVPENNALQSITMAIYENGNGIISAVCHGTAGIVNLKMKNGEHLVKDKKVSGWPEIYENRDKPYFKTFPFLLQKTIENRGGHFSYGERKAVHYEVDGRLITGQSNLTSKIVALKVIEGIKKLKK